MPEIARSRRQAGSWLAQVGAAAGHLAGGLDHRDRARGRQAAGLQLGGGEAGELPGARHVAQARRTRCGVRGDAISRRWIDTARAPSMSCSQTAHASASNGSGRRRGRSQGLRRRSGPEQRVAPEAAVERAQVVVDAEREAHPLDATAAALPIAAPRPGCGPRPPRPTRARSPARRPRAGPGQPLAAAAHHAVAPAAGHPKGAGRDTSHSTSLPGERLPGPRRSALQEVDVDEERARGLHVDSAPPGGQPAAPAREPARGRGRLSTLISTNAATPSTKPPVAAATVAGTETGRGRVQLRWPPRPTGTGRWRTSATRPPRPAPARLPQARDGLARCRRARARVGECTPGADAALGWLTRPSQASPRRRS